MLSPKRNLTQRKSSCWGYKRMTQQEKYESLIARMMLPENYERRNSQVFSDTDTIIANCVADMNRLLSLCDGLDRTASVIKERQFDQNYNKVVSLLDELGWK